MNLVTIPYKRSTHKISRCYQLGLIAYEIIHSSLESKTISNILLPICIERAYLLSIQTKDHNPLKSHL
jgi:hypothetical protein